MHGCLSGRPFTTKNLSHFSRWTLQINSPWNFLFKKMHGCLSGRPFTTKNLSHFSRWTLQINSPWNFLFKKMHGCKPISRIPACRESRFSILIYGTIHVNNYILLRAGRHCPYIFLFFSFTNLISFCTSKTYFTPQSGVYLVERSDKYFHLSTHQLSNPQTRLLFFFF